MNDYDTAALSIFTDATKAAPRLLFASDGLIRRTQSVAPKELIVLELGRITALHPNRGSLMRALPRITWQSWTVWENARSLP